MYVYIFCYTKGVHARNNMYQDTTLQPSAAYLWLDHHPSFTAARTQSDSTKFAINVCDSMTPEQALGVAATIEGWVRNNAAIIGDYTDSLRIKQERLQK